MGRSLTKRHKIIIGLVILSLICGGVIFFFWRKQKSQNASNSSSSAEDGSLPNENNFIQNYPTYVPSPPSSDISEEEAQKQVSKTYYEWTRHKQTPSQIEKNLLKNAAEMDHEEDKMLWKKTANGTLRGSTEAKEKIIQKYQKDIFFSLPSQLKFRQGIWKAEAVRNYFLLETFHLDFKSNGEIDWKISLKGLAKNNDYWDKVPKKTAERRYKETVDYIEKEINPFLTKHGQEFPRLTNLDELNQWANTLARKIRLAKNLLYLWWRSAQKIGKKSLHSFQSPPTETKIVENKKLNLSHPIEIFLVKGQ